MNNYQTDILCTYKQMEDDLEQEELYRIQLLQIFNLNEWNDDLVNNITKELYYKITKTDKSEDFIKILSKAKINNELAFMMAIICPDGEKDEEYELTLFRLLFKYEYFDLTHKCICEHLRNNFINTKTKEELLAEL